MKQFIDWNMFYNKTFSNCNSLEQGDEDRKWAGGLGWLCGPKNNKKRETFQCQTYWPIGHSCTYMYQCWPSYDWDYLPGSSSPWSIKEAWRWFQLSQLVVWCSDNWHYYHNHWGVKLQFSNFAILTSTRPGHLNNDLLTLALLCIVL